MSERARRIAAASASFSSDCTARGTSAVGFSTTRCSANSPAASVSTRGVEGQHQVIRRGRIVAVGLHGPLESLNREIEFSIAHGGPADQVVPQGDRTGTACGAIATT